MNRTPLECGCPCGLITTNSVYRYLKTNHLDFRVGQPLNNGWPTRCQRLAFERAFKMSSWISSEGTVQPEWLKRPRGLDSNRTVWRSPPNRGFGLSEGSGRWGVAQGCNCRSILEAIASLLKAQRHDLAMVLIEQEINSLTCR